MNEKKIEPTQAMVADVLAAKYQLDLMNVRDILRVALNHYDAPGLFADADDRPWEPLSGGPVRVGDEVRQDYFGATTTAVVGRVDADGDPWTTENRFIGELEDGTWHVRRHVQELPEEDGAVIVPADGREYIETRTGKKSRRLTWDAECLVWYDARGTHLRGDITPDTWKEASKARQAGSRWI